MANKVSLSDITLQFSAKIPIVFGFHTFGHGDEV
jgi:hypothetical protein